MFNNFIILIHMINKNGATDKIADFKAFKNLII